MSTVVSQIHRFVREISTSPSSKPRVAKNSDITKAEKLIATAPSLEKLHKIEDRKEKLAAVLEILKWVQALTKLVNPLRSDDSMRNCRIGKVLTTVNLGNYHYFYVYIGQIPYTIGKNGADLEIEANHVDLTRRNCTYKLTLRGGKTLGVELEKTVSENDYIWPKT